MAILTHNSYSFCLAYVFCWLLKKINLYHSFHDYRGNTTRLKVKSLETVAHLANIPDSVNCWFWPFNLSSYFALTFFDFYNRLFSYYRFFTVKYIYFLIAQVILSVVGVSIALGHIRATIKQNSNQLSLQSIQFGLGWGRSTVFW